MVATINRHQDNATEVIPPLAAGDRLTSAEFIRRYNAMPQINKAELIEGVVYVPSPVRNKYHGEPHADILGWLGLYRSSAIPATPFMCREIANFRCFRGEIAYSTPIFDMFSRPLRANLARTVTFLASGRTFCLFSARFVLTRLPQQRSDEAVAGIADRSLTYGTRSSDNATIFLDLDNNPQPDAMLCIERAAGGASENSIDGYLHGSPELLVEIAASTESYDLHDKMNAYRRSGVQEYVVWRVRDGEIDWFQLVEADDDGVVHSRVFPGLRLNVQAMVEADLATVLADLQVGTQSPEHAEFVQMLQDRMADG